VGRSARTLPNGHYKTQLGANLSLQ